MERIEEERPNSFLEYFIFYFQQRILFICDLKILNMYYLVNVSLLSKINAKENKCTQSIV